MHDGKIAQTGSPEDVLLHPGSPFVAELTGAELLLHGTVESVEPGLAAIRIGAGTLLLATSTSPLSEALMARRALASEARP